MYVRAQNLFIILCCDEMADTISRCCELNVNMTDDNMINDNMNDDGSGNVWIKEIEKNFKHEVNLDLI